MTQQIENSLFSAALSCIRASGIEEKIKLTDVTCRAWESGELRLQASTLPEPVSMPGLPEKLLLVAPRKLKSRSLSSPEGHAALIHAICHIEFNAINLAWDAVYRFRDMPSDYYTDWVRIAGEEAYHFSMLRQHLNSLGQEYGDFPAHNGLWEMAIETAYDPLVRMALVPRVLEARGLDVTPGIVKKLRDIGDQEAVDILAIVHRDEIGHVEAGSRWFNYLCGQRGLEPGATFRCLLDKHMRGGIKGPLHRDARKLAGFTEQELDYLEGVI